MDISIKDEKQANANFILALIEAFLVVGYTETTFKDFMTNNKNKKCLGCHHFMKNISIANQFMKSN